MIVLPRQFQSLSEYISRNGVSVKQPPVKKTGLQYGFSLQIKHQWPSKIKINSIGLHFDFMNPIQQKTTVLIKTFETMIGLASNIILQACQWYSGSKVLFEKSMPFFFNCQKSPGPIPPVVRKTPLG